MYGGFERVQVTGGYMQQQIGLLEATDTCFKLTPILRLMLPGLFCFFDNAPAKFQLRIVAYQILGICDNELRIYLHDIKLPLTILQNT